MRRDVKSPAIAALACLAGLAMLLVTAYAIAPFPSADATALNGLEALQGPVATPVLTMVAHTGDPIPLALMLAAIVAVGFRLGRRRQAFAAAGAVIGANVATQILKILLAHPRFHPVLGVNQLAATAFPSGHATAAMSIALAAVIVCPAKLRPRVAPVAALYALAVATSILVLGWHFPSDVLGGFMVAAVFAFGAVAAARQLADRDGARSGPLTARVALPPPSFLLAGMAIVATVAVARHGDLVQFARDHTSAAAALAAVTAACGVLLVGASRFADR
jgi:membrane-associated phospholipid phosphatase